MAVRPITAKQIKVLKKLADRSPMIARWDHQDLVDLLRMGMVERMTTYTTSGSLSASLIWVMAEKGYEFLREERAGR